MILLKGHSAGNNYDGWDPHHHIQLLDMTLSEYQNSTANNGSVFPPSSVAKQILNPWTLPWIKSNLTLTGYDWLEQVSPEHSGYYAFGDRHDGIDVVPFSAIPGQLLGSFQSSYINSNGYRSTTEIYLIQEELSSGDDQYAYRPPQAQEPQVSYEITGEGTAAHSKYWGRQYRILVGGADSGFDVSELHCTFRVEKVLMSRPGFTEVTIYNLSPNLEGTILTEGMRMIVEAGYQSADQYGVVFNGSIMSAYRGKENATTYSLTLQGLDGDEFLNYGFVNESLSKGQPTRNIVDTCLNKIEAPIETGVISSSLAEAQMIRGRVLFGQSSDYLRNIARQNNASFYIENGRANIISAPDLPEGEIFSFDETSGLIGMPEQTDAGITFRVLLNPRLHLNSLVRIEENKINQAQRSLGGFVQPLDRSGIYRIVKLVHEGDTRGQTWYTSCEAVAQDKFNPGW